MIYKELKKNSNQFSFLEFKDDDYFEDSVKNESNESLEKDESEEIRNEKY